MNLAEFTNKIYEILDRNDDFECEKNSAYQFVVKIDDENSFVVKLFYAPRMSKKSQKRKLIIEKLKSDSERFGKRF